MITGESRPVTKEAGDEVIAGTSTDEGSLRVEVTGTGERTALAGIMRLVARGAGVAVPRAGPGRPRGLLPDAGGNRGERPHFRRLDALGASIDFTVVRVVTVLVIACPHALGLAVPLVIAISTTLGARNGLLVRDRRGLEEARNLDTVVFDKTGTLTLGEHRVVDMAAAGIDAEEALRLAAAVERDSEHPIARALLESAEEQGDRLPWPPASGLSRAMASRRRSRGGRSRWAVRRCCGSSA